MFGSGSVNFLNKKVKNLNLDNSIKFYVFRAEVIEKIRYICIIK